VNESIVRIFLSEREKRGRSDLKTRAIEFDGHVAIQISTIG